MSVAELYTKEARVWIPDADIVWKGAILLEDYKGQKELKIQYESGEESVITIKDNSQLPPLQNPDILIGENDLTSLSYLHEPAVLHNLQVRFVEKNIIYTYCGIVLVAINPYEQLPIYDSDTIQAYYGQDMASMDPHIFAVAEEAFKRMVGFDENQSIIVSGESGAGKTVSAKYAMRYFATVCGAEAETQIEKKVLASNPIMEAFGNAKTTRNDNSSRFGKYIEICFSKTNNIIGANMRTYLLEKSRVVFQATQERNYHIFYQLCAAANLLELEHLKLNHCDNFYFTNQGEAPTIPGVDDLDDLSSTQEAFSLLGVNNNKQMEIFRIVSGILHLGNILFHEETDDRCTVPKTDKHLPLMCEMLGVDVEQMRKWLCNRKFITANEVLVKPLTKSQTYFSRDALAKHIYAQLFRWIVDEVNKALHTASKKAKFIGVLDIYGFETFEINSFEQFCINYANEKLQQQFCLHVFKLEQEEYVREGIEWAFIEFYDNQPCIDLIEGKLGILDLLDEECKMPKGSDQNWCQKLYDRHTKAKHFEKPRTSQSSFLIHHFADKVLYQIEGFLEKNRDTVVEEHINILKASQFELVAELFDDHSGDSSSKKSTSLVPGRSTVRPAKEQPKAAQQKQHKQTVASQFRESLNQLMETLFATNPHYIRCIKPNDSKTSFAFEPKRAVQQLRACGVLETIRISAAGYPSRWTYAEFFQRYRVLAHSKEVNRKDSRKTCEMILTKLIERKPSSADRDKYQFGKTKIFFRAGQVAYLEKLRSERLKTCGVVIQKRVRGWLARRRYRKIQRMVAAVQRRGRGALARRQALCLRRTRAVTILQSSWRTYKQHTLYVKMRTAVILMQRCGRALLGLRQFQQLRYSTSAMVLQKSIRGWTARRQYKRVLRGIVLLQSHVRRRIAKRQLKQLKIEARSVEHMKNVAKGLENKIISLQQRLDEKSKEVAVLREEQHRVVEVRAECDRLKGVEMQSRQYSDRLQELEEMLAKMKLALAKEKEAKEIALIEKDNITKEKDQIVATLSQEKLSLKTEVDRLNDLMKMSEKEMTGRNQKLIEEIRVQQEAEYESERANHQKLIKDYARLQQRFENLTSELQMSPALRGHRRSPSEISTISLESAVGETASSEDQGYGTEQRRGKDGQPSGDQNHQPTVSEMLLMTRLQTKVKDLERDRSHLQREVERRSQHGSRSTPDEDAEKEISDAIKIQELEVENSKLLQDLEGLRKAVAESTDLDGTGSKGGMAATKLMEQFRAMMEEMNRRREECIQLRTLLGRSPMGISQVVKEAYGGNSKLVNEDGELEMAYKTQKELNKLLETELQRVQTNAEQREKDLLQVVTELRADNERQQKLIGKLDLQIENLTLSPDARIEATMQHEIARLTSENLDLHEENDKHQEQIRKLKKALKIYAKKLKNTEASDIQAELEKDMADGMPAVKQLADREYSGMFEYRREDEPLLLKNLIIELRPQMAARHIPGLPAYIMFMCIRHTDYVNDDEKVRSLLTNTINGIKKTVKKGQDDAEVITLWLSNTCRLLHCLKQYSGEKAFQSSNTAKQNEHCLRNFDLSEYRQILSDLAVWIYQGLIRLMQSQIQIMIVSAILEHEAIAGLSGTSRPSGLRGRTKSISQEGAPDYSLDALLRALNSFMKVMNLHALDPELVKQVIRQLFYFICSNALNNLLLRKDLCNWSKGMQIRYNVSHLEQWIRDNKMQEMGVPQALEPIIQASQLLQARKTDQDVDSICDMCTQLSLSQVIKLLNLYTPVNEFEERVPTAFIRKIQERLAARQPTDKSQVLLMDTKFFYAVTFPFNPSPLGLETISLPTDWGLGFIKHL